MIPRLVPKISPLDAFCDGRVVEVVVGIGDSRSWIAKTRSFGRKSHSLPPQDSNDGMMETAHQPRYQMIKKTWSK